MQQEEAHISALFAIASVLADCKIEDVVDEQLQQWKGSVLEVWLSRGQVQNTTALEYLTTLYYWLVDEEGAHPTHFSWRWKAHRRNDLQNASKRFLKMQGA